MNWLLSFQRNEWVQKPKEKQEDRDNCHIEHDQQRWKAASAVQVHDTWVTEDFCYVSCDIGVPNWIDHWMKSEVEDLEVLKKNEHCVDDLRHFVFFQNHIQEFEEDIAHRSCEFVDGAELFTEEVHWLRIVPHGVLRKVSGKA